jgi:hypothetical protein
MCSSSDQSRNRANLDRNLEMPVLQQNPASNPSDTAMMALCTVLAPDLERGATL